MDGCSSLGVEHTRADTVLTRDFVTRQAFLADGLSAHLPAACACILQALLLYHLACLMASCYPSHIALRCRDYDTGRYDRNCSR